MQGVRAAVVAGVVFFACACGRSFNDPATAACPHPPVTFGRSVVLQQHREIAVHFTCEGARLAGTLYLPRRGGLRPTVVWLHGSGEQSRLPYKAPLVKSFLRARIGFFSYDKRGVGESEGKCCPDVYGHFNLLTADAVGAVSAMRSAPGVDPAQVGFVGASAAGWIAPRAAELSGHVAFVAIASPGVLQHSIVAGFEHFAGGSESTDPRPSEEEIAKKIASWKPSGFDPKPYLERLEVPALWLLGGGDRNVPPVQSVALLRSIKRERGKDWTIVVYPGAGHGLFDVPPTDPRALPTALAWVRQHVH